MTSNRTTRTCIEHFLSLSTYKPYIRATTRPYPITRAGSQCIAIPMYYNIEIKIRALKNVLQHSIQCYKKLVIPTHFFFGGNMKFSIFLGSILNNMLKHLYVHDRTCSSIRILLINFLACHLMMFLDDAIIF